MNQVIIPNEMFKDVACHECGSVELVQLVTIRYYQGVLSAQQLVSAIQPVFRCADCGESIQFPAKEAQKL